MLPLDDLVLARHDISQEEVKKHAIEAYLNFFIIYFFVVTFFITKKNNISQFDLKM